jgi:hypothetical protein
MITTPFLTSIDSRAAVKGSRDPLGMQQIWVGLGRKVIANLTTVTGSLRDFTITLMGYHFADQLAAEMGPGHTDEHFLKWEQLCAYARFLVNKETGFRGTERVQRNVNEGGRRVRISADAQGQILSDQRTYGLWGLYTVASRTSGFLEGQPDRPSKAARELIDSLYLPRLQGKGAGRGATKILEVLAKPESHIEFEGRDRPMLEAVASILVSKLTAEEKAFYREGLLHGPHEDTGGRQRQLAELVQTNLEAFALAPPALKQWSRMARERGPTWHSLSDRLDRIRIAETVLAPVSGLFTWLLGFDGQDKQIIVQELKKHWGSGLATVELEAFRDLEREFEGSENMPGLRWVEIAAALAQGRYDVLVTLLLAQNKAVMSARGGGAPWVEESQGKMKIRFRDENGDLPDKDELAETLRFPYFIDSLYAMAKALQ